MSAKRLLFSALLLAGCPSGGPAALECFYDGDGDGYGVATPVDATGTTCAEQGAADNPDDCDDGADWIHPNAEDVQADGFDADCDGVDPYPCFLDLDGDGHGDGEAPEPMSYGDCDAAADRAVIDGDCDDGDASIFPLALEIGDDGIDQDCNGVDAAVCWWDGDGDGFGSGEAGVVLEGICGDSAQESLVGGDCRDHLESGGQAWSVYPGAPSLCDGTLSDCDLWPDLEGREPGEWGCRTSFFAGGDALLMPPIPEVNTAFTLEGVFVEDSDDAAYTVLSKYDAAGELELELRILAGRIPELRANGLSWQGSAAADKHLALSVDGFVVSLRSGPTELLSVPLQQTLDLDPTTGFVLGGTMTDGVVDDDGVFHHFRFVRLWDSALGGDALGWLQCRHLHEDLPADRDGLLFQVSGDGSIDDLSGMARHPLIAGTPYFDGCLGFPQEAMVPNANAGW